MISTPDMQARIRREIAMPSRLGHTALLTSAVIVGATVTSLLLTEPALPPRTQLSFLGIVFIAATWMIYAVRVLIYRRVLFGTQRLAAAGLACLFTGLSFVGAVVLREHVGHGAVLTTAALVVVAGLLMLRATRDVNRLRALRIELQKQAQS